MGDPPEAPATVMNAATGPTTPGSLASVPEHAAANHRPTTVTDVCIFRKMV